MRRTRRIEEIDLREAVLGKTEAAKMFAVAVRDYLREIGPLSRGKKFWRLQLMTNVDRWGDRLLFEITSEAIQEELENHRFKIVSWYECAAKPLPRSLSGKNPYTARAYNLLAQLSGFFEWAIRAGRIDHSPMDGISLPPKEEKIHA